MLNCENRDYTDQSKKIINEYLVKIFNELKIKPSKYCWVELHIKIDGENTYERINSVVKTIHKEIPSPTHEG